MPSEKDIEEDPNIILKGGVCKPAILEGHCLPEESYVDFECKPGFKMDEDSGQNNSVFIYIHRSMI